MACVGLQLASSLGSSGTINFDEMMMRGQINSVLVTISNSVKGTPINLTTPSDSDADGFSDTEDKSHTLTVHYSDENQSKQDVYWTKNFLGISDDDDLLEEGERVELTISLAALDQATPLVEDQEFSVEIKPGEGSSLFLTRKTPSRIQTAMNLK